MELIHRLFELQRSLQQKKIGENDAPSINAATSAKKSANGDENGSVGSVSREFQDLAINKKEIEAPDQRPSTDYGVWGWDDNPDGHRTEKVEYENGGNVDSQWNEWNIPSESQVAANKSWGYNDYSEEIKYPVRDGAEDCSFYMKFGSCKFGAACKFNHPPRKSQYHSKSGSYKNGTGRKFSNVLDNGSGSQFLELNTLGYPFRPGAKECQYYVANGSCKYGANCRFHHPERTGSSSGSRISVPKKSQYRAVGTRSQTSSTSEWNGNEVEEAAMTKKIEAMHVSDCVEEIRNYHKMEEKTLNTKDVSHAEVDKGLSEIEIKCKSMASLLHGLGISVEGWPHPTPQQVLTSYKKALLTLHPDSTSHLEVREQVEAEEKFKLINQLKDSTL